MRVTPRLFASVCFLAIFSLPRVFLNSLRLPAAFSNFSIPLHLFHNSPFTIHVFIFFTKRLGVGAILESFRKVSFQTASKGLPLNHSLSFNESSLLINLHSNPSQFSTFTKFLLPISFSTSTCYLIIHYVDNFCGD